MAVDFNQSGAATYLSRAASLGPTEPFTFFCWFNPDLLVNSTTTLIIVENAGNGHENFSLSYEGNLFSNTIFVNTTHGAFQNVTYAASPVVQNVWQCAGGVWRADKSITAYYNGAPGVTDGGGTIPNAVDTTYIGCKDAFSSFVFNFHGCMAHVAIWDAALTDQDMLDLYSGAKMPPDIGSPILYLPMAAAATVEVATIGSDFTKVVGGGSFADCPTSPPVPLPNFGGAYSRIIGLGPMRSVSSPIAPAASPSSYLGSFVDPYLGTYV